MNREPQTMAEVDAYLREHGYDPDEVAERMRAIAARWLVGPGTRVGYTPSDYDEPDRNFPGHGPYPAIVTLVHNEQTPNRYGPYVDLIAFGKKHETKLQHVPNGTGWHSWDIVDAYTPRPKWATPAATATEQPEGSEQ